MDFCGFSVDFDDFLGGPWVAKWISVAFFGISWGPMCFCLTASVWNSKDFYDMTAAADAADAADADADAADADADDDDDDDDDDDPIPDSKAHRRTPGFVQAITLVALFRGGVFLEDENGPSGPLLHLGRFQNPKSIVLWHFKIHWLKNLMLPLENGNFGVYHADKHFQINSC